MNDNTLPQIDWDRWALFLDIDGTLLDLAPTPDAVAVPDGLCALLDSLSIGFSGALALVSGRSLREIDHLFPRGRDAAGSHGSEWRCSGTSLVIGKADWIDAALLHLRSVLRDLPGVFLELKPHSVALHFQQSPQQGPAVLAVMEETARRVAWPLRVLQGRAVVELIPMGCDKGRAIERFMQFSPYAERLPIFVGDDITDEDGFRIVEQRGGVSIRVRDGSDTQGFTLPSSAAVRRWLCTLSHLMEARQRNEYT